MAHAALPGAVEIRRAGLRVTGENVLHLIERRTSKRVVHPLFQEVREFHGLRWSEAGAWPVALCRMPLAEQRTDFAAHSIVQHDDRSHQVRRIFRPSGFGAM